MDYPFPWSSLMSRYFQAGCIAKRFYGQKTSWKGFWSLLRSWLRPHRGISQEKLPLYLGFFEFVHNAKKPEKALLSALLENLLA